MIDTLHNLFRPELEAMSGNDTAWLRMDTSTNLMMITGVMILAEPIELEMLQETVS